MRWTGTARWTETSFILSYKHDFNESEARDSGIQLNPLSNPELLPQISPILCNPLSNPP